VIIDARTDLDFTRFEITFAVIDKSYLPCSGLQNP